MTVIVSAKSAITDQVNTENHIINWEEVTTIGSRSERSTRWIRKAAKIRPESQGVMNRDEGPIPAEPSLRHLTALRSDISRTAEVRKKPELLPKCQLLSRSHTNFQISYSAETSVASYYMLFRILWPPLWKIPRSTSWSKRQTSFGNSEPVHYCLQVSWDFSNMIHLLSLTDILAVLNDDSRTLQSRQARYTCSWSC